MGFMEEPIKVLPQTAARPRPRSWQSPSEGRGRGLQKKPDKCIDGMLQQKPKRSSDDKFPAAAALQRGSVCLIDSL